MMRYVWWQMPFLFGILEMLKNDTRFQAAYVVLSLATAVFTTAAWFVGAGFMI
jgi:hypothetical protein